MAAQWKQGDHLADRVQTRYNCDMVKSRYFEICFTRKRKKMAWVETLLIGYVLDMLMALVLYFLYLFFILRMEQQRIADIFVKKGPYLKMYSTYIKEFDKNIALLDEQCKKNPGFAAVVREFEVFCFHLILSFFGGWGDCFLNFNNLLLVENKP